MSYADIERLSAQAADILKELGVVHQDRVGIVVPNVPAFIVWYYACLRLGAIAVSISTRLNAEEVAFIVSDCGAKAVVGIDSDERLKAMADGLPDCVEHVVPVSEDGLRVAGKPLESCQSIGEGAYAEMEPDDPATILYTSGTTGFPKGATLSHRNVRATMHAFNHLCGMQTDDCLLLSVPLFHCYGQNALLNSGLNVGATIVMQRRFDLGEAKRLIADHQVTMLFGVPTTFQLMEESCQPSDLSSIRYCFSAAAKLPEQLAHSWREKFGMPIFEGYGLTETAPFASYNHRLQFVPGSIGMPVDLVEMKIVDPDTGQQCPAGTPGEIVIRGPNVMLGYWNRADETAAAIRDGWFYSGDIGEVDEQGYFYIVDRLKDMIVVSGLKVFPAEVERVLLDHPAVSEAAVVGFADAVLGEKVAAFIVTAPESNTTAEAIRGHCQAHLGAYKIPGKVVFVDQLPRNPAGKVLKTRLREAELSDLEPSFMQNHESIPAAPTSDSVAARPDLPAVGPLVEKLRATHPASRERLLTTLLQDELRSLTGRADVPDIDEPIINEEIDSLMIVEFRDRLQRQIGTQLQLPATIVFDHPKLSELAVHLLSALEQKEERVGIPPNSSESATPGVLKAGGKAESLQRQTDGPPARQGVRPAGAETASEQIETMSEQQAMEALLREMND